MYRTKNKSRPIACSSYFGIKQEKYIPAVYVYYHCIDIFRTLPFLGRIRQLCVKIPLYSLHIIAFQAEQNADDKQYRQHSCAYQADECIFFPPADIFPVPDENAQIAYHGIYDAQYACGHYYFTCDADNCDVH